MRRYAFGLMMFILTTLLLLAREDIPLPYYNETIPVQNIRKGDPIRLDLRDFICGMEPEKIARIASADEKSETTVFQDASDPLSIAIMPPKDYEGIMFIPIRFDFKDGKTSVIHIIANIRPRYDVSFTLKPDKKANAVFVAGTFNGWNSGANPLTEKNGVWSASLTIEPGLHLYKFVVDGVWIPDPQNPERAPDGFQGFNSVLKAGDAVEDSAPRLLPHFKRTDKTKKVDEYGFMYYDETGKHPLDPQSVKGLVGNEQPLFNFGSENSEKIIVVPVPLGALAGRCLRIYASSKDGIWTTEGFASEPAADGDKSALDWRDAIIYFTFTDRFFNGNPSNDASVKDTRVGAPANWRGGDFAGIEKKIKEGYFDKLGVNALWLSPVNKNADGSWQDSLPPNRWFTCYHGYCPVEPRQTEPRYGSLDELKSLVKTARERGIRIIFDCVANHVHQDHAYFKEHRNWFGILDLPDGRKNIRLFDEFPFTTWFEVFMPSFDYPDNPDARKQVIEDILWWLETTGAEGLRHDATKHIPPIFWRELSRAIRNKIEIPQKMRIYQVGETISDRDTVMEFVGPGLLTGQFDYPLYWKIREAFGLQQLGLDDLASEMDASAAAYGHLAVMSPFMGSHDFPRFISYCDGDLPDPVIKDDKELGWTKQIKVDNPKSYDMQFLAIAFVMMQPGAPMIYYGDEIGMAGAGDPDNRRMMRFGDALTDLEKKMLERCANLIKERRNHSALRRGDSLALLAQKDQMAILKADFNEKILCVFNRAEQEAALSIPLRGIKPQKIAPLFKTATAEIQKDALSVKIPPRSVEFFILTEN